MRKVLAALAVAALTVSVAGTAAAGDDYSDPAYAMRDQANMWESMGRNRGQVSDPNFFLKVQAETTDNHTGGIIEQAQDPTHVAITPGIIFPGWYTGDPDTWPVYREWQAQGRERDVRFRMATGAVVRGQVWKPEGTGPFPAVSITPGSVQATATMYWWAAQLLADNGYIVLTFDAQGQGRSETFGHTDDGQEAPTMDGVPSQQDSGFLPATVDAVDFLLSTPQKPYRLAFSSDASEGINTYNPFGDSVQYLPDGRANVGIAGHSYGATGVSYAQDPAKNTLNIDDIRAVVAWDNLSAAYTPTKPSLAMNAESFIQPSFNPQRPDPESKKTAFKKWRDAGVDVMQVASRAATHMEFAYVDYATAASAWGNDIAKWYTLAWFDKYLKGDATAGARLLTSAFNRPGPCGFEPNCYSIYYKNAYALHDDAGVLRTCEDVAHIVEGARCPDTD